jgi:MFS family permease
MMRNYFASQFKRMFSLPPDAAVDPVIAKNFHHNVLVNFGDIISWLFGSSFLAYNTILPVYASKLTDSPLVIGLIPALVEAGWYLPQLFLVPWVERLPRKLPLVAGLTIFERLPYLGLAMLAFWQNQISLQAAVWIFILLVMVRALLSGLVALPYQEMIATIIPVSHRGRFFGMSHMLGGLLSVLGASIAAWFLDRLPFSNNFALSFFIGFLFILLSYVFLMLTKEPVKAVQPAVGLRPTIQRLKVFVGQNRNFRWFLLSRGFTFMGNMAVGFLAVFAIKRFHLPDGQAAIFTAILMASNTIGYAYWGNIGDQRGYKRLAEIAGLLWLAAIVTAIFSPSREFFYLVFILYGLSSGSGVMADFNIAMEFGSEEDRPAYIGLTRTLTGPLLLVAPLLGGLLVSMVGYPLMFGVSLVFAVAGLLILWLRVVEPRWVNAEL